MNFIQVENNVKLFVQDINPSGEKTIVFIHGWPLDHRMFEYQVNLLPRYGFRCVSFDIRGFGLSGCPWNGYGYTRLAEDIRVITNQLNLKQFILAGFSMGGAIAIRYMSRYAGARVSKLALLAAAAPSFVQRPGYNMGMTSAQVNAFIAQAYKDRPKMVEDFGTIFFASAVSPALRNWFSGLGFDASGIGTIKTLESLRDEDLRSELFSIQVPTGIFHGKKDRVCPFEFAQLMNQQIGGSVLYPFEVSGHAVFYDELDRFNDTFLRFVSD